MFGIQNTCIVKQFMSVVEELKIVSNIKQNDRIATRYGIRIETRDDSTQSLRRWINGENRFNNISALSNVLERSFTFFEDLSNKISDDNYTDNSNMYMKRLLFRLYNNINNSRKGISNLKVTYEHDKSMVSRLDSLLERVEDTIMSIRDTYYIENQSVLTTL